MRAGTELKGQRKGIKVMVVGEKGGKKVADET